MNPRTPWQALTRPRFPLGAWPWRVVGYLASGAVLGAAAGALFLVLGVFSLVLVGLPPLLLSGIALGRVERLRTRIVDLDPAPDPHRVPTAPGLAAWLRTRTKEQATWRELAYALLLATVLWPLDLLALAVGVGLPVALLSAPFQLAVDGHEAKVVKAYLVTSYPEAFAVALLGAVLLVALAYPLAAVAGARAALARALLTPRETEKQAIGEVIASRARLVDAFEAERRRIERDLHDGAQQRLVALTMTLGLARLDAPPGGPLAEQLAKAHEEAGQALTELRELIHGIHPQVLADYGLGPALADAADRSAVPVETDAEALPRLPRAVESAAYFAGCEALANIGRHSGARRARITARHAKGVLRLDVEDDGHGGADPARGSGLTGLADRIAVLDGTLTIMSPPGGPTLLRVEIPCPAPTASSVSSSPRTASSSGRD
ncbi:sensor histidine kinase [Streptomyces vietnamensis]|uniref:histidine kinase n=1 Tax=Streptomyces vietnamensis TaxID=362257 RepID=A0A0B5I4M2_9ACTN|nr:sensor domain-containing protein [Streptomyces vietnamensis]AJF65352.1 histidine kinase [Streptomyces vietnamensis]